MKRQITYGLLAGIAFWGLTSFSAYSATSDPPDSPCDDNNACTEEVFDGKDCQYRDLDGSVPCYTGPAGTRNVGQCKPGTLQCVKGIGMGTCQNEILPSKEQCNGIDNDCDGQTDEGFFAGDECTVMLNGCSQQGARICRADGSGADCQPLTNIKKNQCGICDGPPVSGLGNACSTLDFVSGCQQQGTFACNAAGDGIRCNPTTNIVKNACGVCGGPAIANANLLNTPCSDGEGNCSGSGTFQCNGAGNQILCSAQAMADGTICDDSYPCQNPATCQAGNCVAGSSKNTNDGNACTTDSCDPQTGIISHTPLAAIGQSCNTTMNDCPQTGLNICNLQYGAITCQVANPVSKNACGVCGIHTPQETCEEGVTALKPNEQCVDCQIVVTPPVGSNCSSNIFDCSRAIVIDLPITGTLNDFTILNPKNYDKEILVFAGANANNNANNRGGLFFAASKDIPTSGLKYCKTANDPLQHIKTANLRGYGEKDLIATTEKQYAVLADFETMAKDSLAQGCHLTPVLLSDPGESRGAPDLDLKLEKIHDIASVANENNLSSVIGALELKKEQGQGNKKFIGVDILSGIGNTFKKDFFVWQESPFQNSENILSLKIDAANGLADFRILATFSSQGVTRTESYGCSFSAEALSCTAPEKLPGR
ncbi:MAG: hypothetical protein U1D33_03670, partial [bacterium]|nr:hypothetical protein [bacterium]